MKYLMTNWIWTYAETHNFVLKEELQQRTYKQVKSKIKPLISCIYFFHNKMHKLYGCSMLLYELNITHLCKGVYTYLNSEHHISLHTHTISVNKISHQPFLVIRGPRCWLHMTNWSLFRSWLWLVFNMGRKMSKFSL